MKIMKEEQMVVVDLIQIASDPYKEFELNAEIETKRCNKCDKRKTHNDFYKNGEDKTCKDCRRIARSQRYERNKSLAKDELNTVSDAGVLHEHNKCKRANLPPLLSPEDIYKIAEVLLILEGWVADSDTQ
jgi:hypothetical protein